MRNVFLFSFSIARIATAAALGISTLCLSPAHAGETVSVPVGTFVLSDEEIAQRCSASIKGEIDMVNADEGNGIARKVPRCVFTYENMRNIADGYAKAEKTARDEVIAATTKTDCQGQADCIDASQKMYSTAVRAHQNLLTISEESQARLSEITQIEVVKQEPILGDPTLNNRRGAEPGSQNRAPASIP